MELAEMRRKVNVLTDQQQPSACHHYEIQKDEGEMQIEKKVDRNHPC